MIGAKCLLLILFPLVFASAIAQVNYPFVKHLSEHNLSKEHLSYIAQLSGKSKEVSANYLKAKYYLQYVNDSLFYNVKRLLMLKNNSYNCTNYNLYYTYEKITFTNCVCCLCCNR